MDIWVVYDRPKDYPNEFVARRFQNMMPTEEKYTAADLKSVREYLARKGLSRLDRMPGDDKVIVETWL